MLNGKLTQKDVTEWCRTHSCTKENCKYLTDYCHIHDNLLEDCQKCIDGYCKKCKKYK